MVSQMNEWEFPKYPDRGPCRVWFHESKLWEAGWVIVEWLNADTVACKRNGFGLSLQTFRPSQVQVRG